MSIQFSFSQWLSVPPASIDQNSLQKEKETEKETSYDGNEIKTLAADCNGEAVPIKEAEIPIKGEKGNQNGQLISFMVDTDTNIYMPCKKKGCEGVLSVPSESRHASKFDCPLCQKLHTFCIDCDSVYINFRKHKVRGHTLYEFQKTQIKMAKRDEKGLFLPLLHDENESPFACDIIREYGKGQEEEDRLERRLVDRPRSFAASESETMTTTEKMKSIMIKASSNNALDLVSGENDLMPDIEMEKEDKVRDISSISIKNKSNRSQFGRKNSYKKRKKQATLQIIHREQAYINSKLDQLQQEKHSLQQEKQMLESKYFRKKLATIAKKALQIQTVAETEFSSSDINFLRKLSKLSYPYLLDDESSSHLNDSDEEVPNPFLLDDESSYYLKDSDVEVIDGGFGNDRDNKDERSDRCDAWYKDDACDAENRRDITDGSSFSLIRQSRNQLESGFISSTEYVTHLNTIHPTPL